MELLKLAMLLLLRTDRCLQAERRLPFRNVRFDLEDVVEPAGENLAAIRQADLEMAWLHRIEQARQAVIRRMNQIQQFVMHTQAEGRQLSNIENILFDNEMRILREHYEILNSPVEELLPRLIGGAGQAEQGPPALRRPIDDVDGNVEQGPPARRRRMIAGDGEVEQDQGREDEEEIEEDLELEGEEGLQGDGPVDTGERQREAERLEQELDDYDQCNCE